MRSRHADSGAVSAAGAIPGRTGQVGRHPITLVLAIMLLIVIAAAIVAVYQPKLLSFTSDSNQTIASSILSIGDFL
ncbi:MAG: hypothetical protein SVW77_03410 [Candidatus Nanohaloarchaea archaeon]|nr:hypothetical protein [Candidatus Nanohaloarchaea archaeon]